MTEPLLELMSVQSGGGTNDGCFGLDQKFFADPTGVHVDADLSTEYGDRLQLCLAGFDPTTPVEITITSPTGDVAVLTAALDLAGEQEFDSPSKWFDFTPGGIEAVTFTPFQGGDVFESPFRPVDTAMPPGDYLIGATQGAAEATSIVALIPAARQTGPTVLQLGPTSYRVTVASMSQQALEVGLYAASEGMTISAELVRELGIAVLNEQGVASVDFQVADVAPGRYCVLTVESTACVDNALYL